MGIFSSIDCSEAAGTSVENGDVNSGVNCQVVLQCAFADRWALINDILGTPRPWPKLTTGLVPYAVNASARPMNIDYTADGQIAAYSGDALVTVSYSTQIVDIAAESLEPSTDYQQINPLLFHWTNGNTGKSLSENESVPFLLRKLDIVRTRYRLTAIPTQYLTCLGKVNQATYTSAILGLSFPAETLLFQPQGASRSFTNLTVSGWTVGARFSYNPNGWNKFWNTENQAFEFIYLTGAGTTPYKPHQLADFAALFS